MSSRSRQLHAYGSQKQQIQRPPGLLTGLGIDPKPKELEQYFFSEKTAYELARLARGKTACICTPSVGLLLSHRDEQYKADEVYIFDKDERLGQLKLDGVLLVEYDLYKGLHSHCGDDGVKSLHSNFSYYFNTVIFDPPFSLEIRMVLKQINAFLGWEKGDVAYLSYPVRGFDLIRSHSAEFGLLVCEHNRFEIEYLSPPKSYKRGGSEDTLNQFVYISLKEIWREI
ncbi:hypothetical protein D6810_00600 [Candidatus Dojkabacteria bacterium]|uniref:Uncharacterized protein n=1 Tax=Candidatus Dojkabacteria bacterium TaxID=2099670 RepID=A0A3M0Z1P2_9BACT|nr:MAG: hypothetical protein D6810_00600 [Candidatus Dojkabacteria bacterium]